MNVSIEKLKPSDYLTIKKIWKQCFGDNDEFLDVYFSDIIDPTHGFALTENGKIVSDLFMLPFKAKMADKELNTEFLAGCATLPEARRKDYMKTLIKYTLKYFLKSGLSVTYLHPFKHSFYRKFGYETIAYVNNYEINKVKSINNDVVIVSGFNHIPLDKMYIAYNTLMKRFDNCFLRSKARFNAWIKLLYADGGKAACIYNKSRNSLSYALYYENDDVCNIFEIVADNKSELDLLLSGIPYNSINYFLPTLNNYKQSDNEEFTMMRVLDPIGVINNYQFEYRENFVVKITDDFLERDYCVSVKFLGKETQIENSDGKPDIEIDINRLAQLLTGSYSLDVTDLEKAVFKRQNACFFETY